MSKLRVRCSHRAKPVELGWESANNSAMAVKKPAIKIPNRASRPGGRKLSVGTIDMCTEPEVMQSNLNQNENYCQKQEKTRSGRKDPTNKRTQWRNIKNLML